MEGTSHRQATGENSEATYGPLWRRFIEPCAHLLLHSERNPGERHCRVIGNRGSDNPGKSALSGTSTLRCHANNRDGWF